MNFGSKVAVVLLLLAVVLCPSVACAMSAGPTSQASHPCCPPAKSHDGPAQRSDCRCVSAQPPAPQAALNTSATALAEAPVAIATTQTIADPGHAFVSLPFPLSDQDAFVAVHQFRI